MLKIESVQFASAARPQRAKMRSTHYISYLKTLARADPSEARVSASISNIVFNCSWPVLRIIRVYIQFMPKLTQLIDLNEVESFVELET